ncbi:hypothetical protein ACPV5V_19340 [Vibrio campbellii]
MNTDTFNSLFGIAVGLFCMWFMIYYIAQFWVTHRLVRMGLFHACMSVWLADTLIIMHDKLVLGDSVLYISDGLRIYTLLAVYVCFSDKIESWCSRVQKEIEEEEKSDHWN